MRAVIFANGDLKQPEFYQDYILPGDFIICADGGYAHVLELGPVSYTHLDVYKRQAVFRAGRRGDADLPRIGSG